MYCPNCGKEIEENAKFCGHCGDELGREREEVSILSMKKAGAGVRFGSGIIDYFIVLIFAFVIGIISALTGVGSEFIENAPNEIVGIVIGIPFWLVYSTYFFGSGQTLGMKTMRLKLIRPDGEYPVGYGKGFLRGISMIIPSSIFYLGYIWILIDENKQGWHDKIVDTYVVVE